MHKSHEDEPNSLGSQRTTTSVPHRLFGKQAPQHESLQELGRADRRAPEGPEAEGRAADAASSTERARDGERSLLQPPSLSTGPGEDHHRKVQRERSSHSVRGHQVPGVDVDTPKLEREVCQPPDVRAAPSGLGPDREEFFRRASHIRQHKRGGLDRRDDSGRARGRGPILQGEDGHRHRDHGGTQGAGEPTAGGERPAAADPVPGHGTNQPVQGDDRGAEPSASSRGERPDARTEVRRARSRSPFPQRTTGQEFVFQHDCRLECIPEELGSDVACFEELEAVGSISEKTGHLSSKEPENVSTGCFEWQGCSPETSGELLEDPVNKNQGLIVGQPDKCLFVTALEQGCEVFEIALDIQARDVHRVKQSGRASWVLNEKPKKRAEVQFRTLQDSDKLDFMKAMQGELSSYLEHEAVAIAKRHNVPPERILGMRWVLTWKVVEDGGGNQVGQKPKARLIIKGYQDPDLLTLKRDSPTLSTQNRNMVLALTACNHWRAYVGDIKTAFLNGDKTEIDREIFAEPPEEVRRMLNMKDSELFRIQKAVYGLNTCSTSLGRQACSGT